MITMETLPHAHSHEELLDRISLMSMEAVSRLFYNFDIERISSHIDNDDSRSRFLYDVNAALIAFHKKVNVLSRNASFIIDTHKQSCVEYVHKYIYDFYCETYLRIDDICRKYDEKESRSYVT